MEELSFIYHYSKGFLIKFKQEFPPNLLFKYFDLEHYIWIKTDVFTSCIRSIPSYLTKNYIAISRYKY